MNNKEVQDSLKQVGIRLVEKPPLLSPEPINSPEAAVRILGKWLSEMDRELFCVVNLNTNLTPINMNVVSMGALNEAYVHPRETLKSAILSNSAYLMLVHNHLGSLNPSKEDITLTDRIQSAASIMGIPVLDHIIVGRNQEFFSLRENNVFSFENDMSYTSELSKLQWTQQMNIAERSAITDRLQELQKNREEKKTEDVKVINSIEGIDFNTDADPQGTGGIKVADERILFTRKEDFYAIYQYDHTDGNWGYEFMGLDFAENMGMTVDGKDYRLMYLNTLNKDDTLDQLFMKFNIDRPDDFEGHSLSTSDVIIMKREGELKAYYVDSIGFKKLPNFALQRADLLNVSIKSEYPPVYMETWENAFEKKEVDAYLDSRMLNISCKNAVEQAITENYNGKYLDSNGVFAVIEKFGVERVRYVLANTLQQRSNDGRFSRQNISWAEQIKIPENITQGKNHNLDYVIESHSAVLNGFVDMARVEFRTRRVEQLLDEVEERMPEVELDELAYKINDKYFAIQKTEGGYDYTYYDENYRDIDGGIYEDDTVPITEVVQNLLDEEGLSLNDAKEIDYEELQSNIDDVHMQEYTKDAENYLDQNEIKKLAVDLDNFSYDYDPYVYNDNVENKEEQVEKIIESIMNHDIEGFKEWLTTVTEESAIDSEVRSAYSLLSRLENAEKNFTITKVPEQNHLSFYVAECMEFPTLGEFYENLTLEEAIRIYENIPADRMNGIKGIGFELKDGSDYEGTYELMHLGKVDRENVEMIQHYKKNPDIQKALDVLEKYCEEKSLSKKNVPEIQQNLNRKKKQQSIQRGLYR